MEEVPIDPEPYASTILLVGNILKHQLDYNFYIAIFVMVFLLILSALISGSEVAFFSLKEKQFSNNQDDHAEKRIKNLLQNPKNLLASILISNNFVNISIIILFTLTAQKYFDLTAYWFLSFLVEILAVTFLLVIFGELIPKIYANQANLAFSKSLVKPISLLVKIMKPFSTLLVRSSNMIERKINKQQQNFSAEDLHAVIDITSGEEKLSEEKQFLKRIVNFSNVMVKQIMVSRMDVVSFEANSSFNQIMNDINEIRFSRIPIHEDSPDNIIGILYIKDLLPHFDKKDDFPWVKLLRKPYYVPENKKIDDLLKEFQSKKIHLAIVVDEYGGFSGLITLEDILEEIVGEITDEFDEDEEELYQKLDDNNFLFNARTPLNDLIKALALQDDFFEDYKGESESVGGLVIEMLGRIPKVEEKLRIKNLEFQIKSAEKKRIKEVLVSLD